MPVDVCVGKICDLARELFWRMMQGKYTLMRFIQKASEVYNPYTFPVLFELEEDLEMLFLDQQEEKPFIIHPFIYTAPPLDPIEEKLKEFGKAIHNSNRRLILNAVVRPQLYAEKRGKIDDMPPPIQDQELTIIEPSTTVKPPVYKNPFPEPKRLKGPPMSRQEMISKGYQPDPKQSVEWNTLMFLNKGLNKQQETLLEHHRNTWWCLPGFFKD